VVFLYRPLSLLIFQRKYPKTVFFKIFREKQGLLTELCAALRNNPARSTAQEELLVIKES
jgi:hypothetical protein